MQDILNYWLDASAAMREKMERTSRITATDAREFARTLRVPCARALAMRAVDSPAHARLPMLARAMQDERTAPHTSAPKRARTHAPDTRGSLLRVLSVYGECESHRPALLIALAAHAQRYNISVRKSTVRAPAPTTDRAPVVFALLNFAHNPSAAALSSAYDALRRLDLAHEAQRNLIPARIMHPTVRAPEPPKFQPRTVPIGAIDWQTDALVSVDPAQHVEYSKRQARKTRTKRVHECKRRKPNRKRANAVSAPTYKPWAARLGRPVLSLRKDK